MRIAFNHVDKVYYGVDELIKPVINSALGYDVFIGIVCEILNTFNTYNEHIVNDVKKALKLFQYRIDVEDKEMMSAYCEFSEKMEAFYWNVVDDDFALEIKRFSDQQFYQEKLRYVDYRLGRYRGLFFEELIIALVKNRFFGETFETGCRVYINGARVIAHYGEGNAQHKETIDIAGWVEKVRYGEFYECKINPTRFVKENYMYFSELKRVLDDNKVGSYVIGFVSADARTNLQMQVRYLESNYPEFDTKFELIGREDIFKLKDLRIPEIA